MKLYEITTSLLSLWEEAAEVLDIGNTDTEEQAKALQYLEQQLSAMEGTHASKCLDIARLIKNTEAEALAVAAEEERLRARRRTAEKKAEWLRTYLASNMEPGLNIKDSNTVIGWRKSTAVEVTVKPDDLPENLRRTKITVDADKAAIKAAIESGEAVAGCSLVQRFNLQVK